MPHSTFRKARLSAVVGAPQAVAAEELPARNFIPPADDETECQSACNNGSDSLLMMSADGLSLSRQRGQRHAAEVSTVVRDPIGSGH